MQDKDIKAKELCDKTGLSASYISKLLSGALKDPTFIKACKIIEAIGMTPDEFLALEESDQ